MKVLAFDVWGDLAHFRKFYTTTSPLTFPFPPPPTIAGMLGAIYGTTKETNQHLKLFGGPECLLGVRIVNPVRKIRMGINLIDTKRDWTPKVRTQIRTEFVKSPRYRIYFAHQDAQIYQDLKQLIMEHRSVYTVALGLSELLADFGFGNEFEVQRVVPETPVDISTPITAGNLVPDGLVVETGKRYIKEKIPLIMNTDRVVERYDEVIYELDGKPIRANVRECWQLNNGELITFFRTSFSSGDSP
ncbi:MAG: type I-B CRISPR-associated protein Cas5b [candidate division WOR-3 bacterium]